MDANQMVLEFKLSSDSLDSCTIPDLSNENILYYLNVAQDVIIKTRYGGNNLYRTGFEGSQKRTDDLNEIVKSYYFAATSSGTNTYFVDLTQPFTNEALTTPSTDEYMTYLRGNAQVVSSSCGNKFVGIKLETLDNLDKVLVDPFKQPTLKRVIGHFENGGIYLHSSSSYSIGKALITCLKMPVQISNDELYAPVADCELNPSLHREIIAKAVELAVGDIKPEKFQIKAQQNTQIE
jgi:hypothetical protein